MTKATHFLYTDYKIPTKRGPHHADNLLTDKSSACNHDTFMKITIYA